MELAAMGFHLQFPCPFSNMVDCGEVMFKHLFLSIRFLQGQHSIASFFVDDF
jgi:hypothetical protein